MRHRTRHHGNLLPSLFKSQSETRLASPQIYDEDRAGSPSLSDHQKLGLGIARSLTFHETIPESSLT
jgi:hypothetical protein